MSVSVIGIEDLIEIMDELAPKYAANLARATMHGIAGRIAKEAKTRASVDEGTLKKGIKAKRRRSPPERPVSDVVVESGKGKKSAFYWRFVEYGTGGLEPQPEQPFLRPAKDLIVSKMPEILDEEIKKKLVGMVNREKKKAAKK